MEIIRKHFDTIDSTNTYGKLNCHFFEKNKITLVTADSQTGGRGRFKRQWVSPAFENIYATFCFFIDKNRPDIGNIPQVLAISCANVLQDLQFFPKLKWPNDILLSNKKMAGILCETVSFPDSFAVILGIGININMPLETLSKIDRPATSLLNETGKRFEVESVLKLLQDQFSKDLNVFLKSSFKPFLDDYRNLIWTAKNEKIRFHDNVNIVEGFFDSINDDGTLNLMLENGQIKRFISGEFLP